MLIEEQSSGAQPSIPAVPTVGIGASAGGLKAMQAFFKNVASDLEIRNGVNSLSVSSSAKARPIPYAGDNDGRLIHLRAELDRLS